MIRKLIPGSLALGLIAFSHAQPAAPAAPAPAPEAPKVAVDPAEIKTNSSYFFGFRTGKQFGSYGLTSDDIDTDAFLKGLIASFKAGEADINTDKFKNSMQALGDLLQEREKTKAAANLAAGKKFLEENGKRKEVTTTKSGLQYEVLAKGGAEKLPALKEGEEGSKQFLVKHKGTLIDGTQFDASPETEPSVMTLLDNIEGIKEALKLMPVEAKWKLFIPSELAYGEERAGAEVAPNSVLVYEIELLKIQDAPPVTEGGGFPIPIPGAGE